MISKRTIISQIEVTEVGHLQLRLAKQIVEDGKVLSSEYHRTSVECGGNVAAQMQAVNTDLVSMNCEPVSAGDIARITAIANTDWTPERKSAWTQMKAASLATLRNP